MRPAFAALIPLAALALLAGCNAHRGEATLHVDKGDAAVAMGDFDAALVEFQHATQLDPNFAAAHAGLGHVYKEKGNLEKAADELQTAVKLDPDKYDPVFELGEVYRLLERMAFAIKAYAIACQLDPKSFEAHFRLASCYHQAGELDKAAETYKAAIRLNPRSDDAWSNLGAVYDSRGEFYDAIRAYKQAIECCDGGHAGRAPNEPDKRATILVNLGTAYINQERWQIARQTLDKALKFDDTLAIAHVRLGYCHWRENHPDEAAQCYLRALNLDPENSEAFKGYGVVRMTQYIAEPEKVAFRDEAVEAWHKSLELNPNQPKLRTLIERYRVKGDRPVLNLDE